MNVETPSQKVNAESSGTELWIALCKVMAVLMAKLPEEDRGDLAELLQVMGQSDEEMEQGEVTIREILTPKSGNVIPMFDPLATDRSSKVEKWASYAGEKIRAFRKKSGITQEKLAEETGLPQSHISRIENGEISPTRLTLEKIAKALKQPLTNFDPSY